MRTMLAVIALVAATCAVVADDLSNGAFIVHSVPEYQFGYRYVPPGGYCSVLDTYPLYSFADRTPCVNMPQPYGYDHFFVLAAWDEPKEFCAAEFGLGMYDQSIMLGFPTHTPCGEDPLVIPTSGWPGPNEGIAISVAAENAWYGQFVPVYFFAVYGYYASYGSTEIPLIPDPAQDFIGTASCDTPPVVYPAVFADVLGVNQPDCGSVFVCCLEDGTCELVHFEGECEEAGGTSHPEWSSCDPNPCPSLGACCAGPDGHDCHILPLEECEALDGHWIPEILECEPDTCDPFTPTEKVNWGSVKRMYR